MKRVLQFAFALLLSAFQTLHAQPQEVFFQHLTSKDGLSHGAVRTMLQDRQGFLWFGTSDGLNKFDGYKFTVYRQQVGKTNSLSSSYISGLTEDQAGRIWISTIDGLNRFDPETERFVQYRQELSPEIESSKLTTLLADQQQNLWVGTRAAGLYRLKLNQPESLDPAKARFKQYKLTDEAGISDTAITSLHTDSKGNVWVITPGALYQYNLAKDTFTPALGPGIRDNPDFHQIFVLHEGIRDGTYILGTTDGVYEYDAKSRTYRNALPAFAGAVTGMAQDHSGIIWLSTYYDGLVGWDRKTGKFRSYVNDPQKPGSIAKGMPLTVFADRAGSLWAGVWKTGLSRLDHINQQFAEYSGASAAGFHNSGRKIAAMAEDKNGVLWLSDFNSGKLVMLDRKNAITRNFEVPLFPNPSETDNAIIEIVPDPDGTLWLATQRQGLYHFDPAKGSFLSLGAEIAKLSTDQALALQSLTLDKHGNLWLGTTREGVVKYNPKQHKAWHLTQSKSNNSLGSNNIQSIRATADGQIWVSTWGAGLAKIDPVINQVTRIAQGTGRLAFPSATANTLFEDSRKRLWIGTQLGLFLADRERNTFTHYGEPHGLQNLIVQGIAEDKHGNIWINTDNHISRLDLSTGRFQNYNIHDSRSSESHGTQACLISKSGEMFFGRSDGLIGFYPEKLQRNDVRPPVYITQIQVLNKPVLVGEAVEDAKPLLALAPAFAKELVLDYWQNVVSFEFAALNFTRPLDNQYAYQLEGFDKDWVQAGNKREATYTNLDPGTYTFRVKGSNNDGLWNEEPQTIQLTILPPPWRTWWAYALYALVACGLIYSMMRYWSARERWSQALRLRQLEAQKLQELDTIKTRFFTNISHEFRTPLTLIVSPLEQLLQLPVQDERIRKNHQLMHRNAQRLMQLISQLLDISKLEAGNMQLQAAEHDLVRYCKGLVYSFSSLAESRQISLEFHCEEQEMKVYFDRDKLEKIISNLLANAFKFTSDGGTVAVHLAKTANSAQIQVTDTGIGIPQDRLDKIFNRFYQVDSSHTRQHEGTGIGLALTKELVQLHKGEISVQSEPGKGATFLVNLPLGHAHLKPEQIVAHQPEIQPLQSTKTGFSPQIHEAAAIVPELDERESAPLLLIVEDNADVRAYIRDNFEENYRVLEAVNGEQGLEMAIEHVPDLIISDLMMPLMDGVELCRGLKTDERTSHVPVMLLTAKATIESRIEGLETGADDYLTKPFQPQELQVRARNLIAQRKKLQAYFRKAAGTTPHAAAVSTTELAAAETIKLEPGEVLVTSADKKFLQRAIAVVETNMANEEFDVEQFGQEMALSRVQLYRKLKALTGQTASEFVRSLRLKRAAQLLEQEAGNVAEVAYQVGFQNLSYFSKCFKEEHGCSPSEYGAQKAALSLER